ncbi:MAG: sarcosine oxidase subunit gamma family protein [Pseudoruegeria sp.]
MSNAVSALQGKVHEGMASVSEMGLQGMVTLRGDLNDPKFTKAVTSALGLDVPGLRGVVITDKTTIAWMSPDELLVSVAHDMADATVAALNTALAEQHHMAVNVSDARVVVEISGRGAREVLAKLAPVDLSSTAFGPGQIRRTRIAQVPAAFWMTEEDRFILVAFRSVAQYVFDVLAVSAAQNTEVGFLK